MFKGKKAVIFDLDGTLLNSVGIWNRVDEELIARIRTDGKTGADGFPASRDRKLRELASRPDPYVAYCGFLGETYGSTLTAEQIHALRYEISGEFLERLVDYKPRADELVRLLHSFGLRLAVATTTRRRNVDIYRTRNLNIMRKANLDDYFSPVIAKEDVKRLKPHPEAFLRVMDKLAVKPEDCLVFEDSLTGMLAARAAGIEAVAVYDEFSDDDRARIDELAAYRVDDYADAIAAAKDERA